MSLVSCVLIACAVFLTPIAAAADEYPFLCRGPFEVANQGDLSAKVDVGQLRIHFKPNRSAAGEGGKKLEPGTCTWGDRAMRRGEPTELRYWYYSTRATPFSISLMEKGGTLIAECSMEETCVLKLRARNQGAYLEAAGSDVSTLHPQFEPVVRVLDRPDALKNPKIFP